MITISLRQLLDLTGFSSGTNYKGSQLAGVLDIPAIRGALIRKIKGDYAGNKMADLLHNISDQGFSTDIFTQFKTYITNESKPPEASNPVFINKPIQERDNLKELINGISSVAKEVSTESTTAAGSQFLFNTEQFIIQLSVPEIASLDPVSLSTLSVTGLQPEPIVPQSAIMMNAHNAGEKYAKQPFPVYTGIDMRVLFMTPHIISQNITLKVLTYSTHSGLIPVSTLGRKRPKGFAEGDTNIAGTMVATLTVNDPLADMQPLLYGATNYAKSTSDIWRTYLMPDQFPLFDVVLLFSNEAGFTSSMVLFGIKITDTGSVMSMSDSEIEVTYTYTALDIDLLRGVVGEGNDKIETFDILQNNEYLTRRKMAYDGNSTHRDHFEVGEIYGKLDNRAREIAYNNMRMEGLSLVDVYNFQRFNGEI